MSGGPLWPAAATDELCERIGSGESLTAAGKAIGRSRGSAIGRFNRLIKDTDHWTPASVGRFCDLVADGFPLGHAGEVMGVTPEAAAARFALIRKAMGPQAR